MILGQRVFGHNVLNEKGSIGLHQILLGRIGTVYSIQLGVDSALLPGQEDAVPGRPLLLTLPPSKTQVKQVT